MPPKGKPSRQRNTAAAPSGSGANRQSSPVTRQQQQQQRAGEQQKPAIEDATAPVTRGRGRPKGTQNKKTRGKEVEVPREVEEIVEDREMEEQGDEQEQEHEEIQEQRQEAENSQEHPAELESMTIVAEQGEQKEQDEQKKEEEKEVQEVQEAQEQEEKRRIRLREREVLNSDEEDPEIYLLEEMDTRSISNRSTSVSTSGTQLETDVLDPTLAIEAIPALHRKSQDSLEFLTATSSALLLKKVRQPGSSAAKRLDFSTKDFAITKDLFATSTEFIKVSVSNQLLQTDMFAPLICKANYAALALGLFRTVGLSNEAVQYLMGLEMFFPSEFFPKPGVWTKEVRMQVSKLMLEIRTQLFIAAVYHEQSLPLDDFLRQIFLEPTPDPNSNDEDEIHEAWAMGCKPKGWDSLTKSEKRDCKSRISRIRSCYNEVVAGTDRMEPLDVDYLTQNWPWDKFVEQIMKFISKRTEEINTTFDIKDLLQIAEDARQRGLQSPEEDEAEEGEEDEMGSNVGDEDLGGDLNWLTDQSRTLIEPEIIVVDDDDEEMEDVNGDGDVVVVDHKKLHSISQKGKNVPTRGKKRSRDTDDRLSSTQLRFLKRQKQLLEASRSPPPPAKKPAPQKSKIVTNKAGMRTLKAISQNFSQASATQVVPPAGTGTTHPLHPSEPSAAPTQTREKNREFRFNAKASKPNPVQRNTIQDIRGQPSFDPVDAAPIQIPAGTAEQVELYNSIEQRRSKGDGEKPVVKRSMYDRQPNARRLSFNDERELTGAQDIGDIGPSRRQKKRNHAEVEEEEEENPFGQDTRPEDPQRKKRSRATPPPLAQARANRLVAEPAPRPVRHRPLPAEIAPQRERQASVERPQPANRRNRQASAEPQGAVPRRNRQPFDDPNDIPGLENGYGDLRERIRHAGARRRLQTIGKPTQKRNRWTDVEETKLIEMVGLFGCRWSLIDQMASAVLGSRGQVALKDKARNIKFSLLKARMPLPKNFEFVTMSKNYYRELEQMGIDLGRANAGLDAVEDIEDDESEAEDFIIDNRSRSASLRHGGTYY